jgi:hypothetical protein
MAKFFAMRTLKRNGTDEFCRQYDEQALTRYISLLRLVNPIAATRSKARLRCRRAVFVFFPRDCGTPRLASTQTTPSATTSSGAIDKMFLVLCYGSGWRRTLFKICSMVALELALNSPRSVAIRPSRQSGREGVLPTGRFPQGKE